MLVANIWRQRYTQHFWAELARAHRAPWSAREAHVAQHNLVLEPVAVFRSVKGSAKVVKPRGWRPVFVLLTLSQPRDHLPPHRPCLYPSPRPPYRP
jgi:hypothetical protein